MDRMPREGDSEVTTKLTTEADQCVGQSSRRRRIPACSPRPAAAWFSDRGTTRTAADQSDWNWKLNVATIILKIWREGRKYFI